MHTSVFFGTVLPMVSELRPTHSVHVLNDPDISMLHQNPNAWYGDLGLVVRATDY